MNRGIAGAGVTGRWLPRAAVHGAVLVASSLVVLVAAAAPAWAHGGPGVDDLAASNYRASIDHFDPGATGIHLRTIDATTRLELENRTAHEVVVLGYEGEPYLRVRHDAVFENVRSPSTSINATMAGGTSAPPEADARAAPEWRRISSGPIVRWHDHRSHWMAPTPPAVEQDPSTEQVVEANWVVPMQVDGRRIDARGSITWVPGPAPWPWLGAVAMLAGVTIGGALTRRWRATVVIASVALLAACTTDVIGTWAISSDPATTKLAALATPILGAVCLVAGLVVVMRREREGVLLIAGAAAGLGLLFGWVSRNYLTYSQIPTTLDPTVARLTVTVALGLGVGLTGVAVVRFRHELALLLGPQRQGSRRPTAGPNRTARRAAARRARTTAR